MSACADDLQDNHDAEQTQRALNPRQMRGEIPRKGGQQNDFHESHEKHIRGAVGQEFENFHSGSSIQKRSYGYAFIISRVGLQKLELSD